MQVLINWISFMLRQKTVISQFILFATVHLLGNLRKKRYIYQDAKRANDVTIIRSLYFVYLFFFLRFLSSKGVMLFAQIAIVEALCRSAEADGCKSPKAPDSRSIELNSSINL